MMNAVLSSFSEGITFMLQSFRLAFVVPSTIFVGLNSLFILPSLPKTEYGDQFLKFDTNNQLVVILAVSFLLGYFLSIINIWLIRLFEGYHWRDTWLGRKLIYRKQAEREAWRNYINVRIDEIISAQKLPLKNPERQRVMAGFDELSHVTEPMVSQLIQERFPITQEPFLPTTLGNAIAAFEDYPKAKYGIDAVLLWPRLLPTLTQKKFAPYIERSKSQFDFLINLCFLLFIYSFETFCIAMAFAEDWSLWIIGTGIFLTIVFVLYKLAVVSVHGWGMAVRVAFDLHRYDLLGSLFGTVPTNFSEEKDMWITISRFLNRVHLVRSFEHFENSKHDDEPFDYAKIKLYLDQVGSEAKQKGD